jgi:DNA invertase Pin-like site-specific DNA recombinase
MRAAIYTRISRAEDRSGVERHTELCQALCDLRGYEVVGVYEDNDISATAKRPAYDRLVKDLASG